MAIILSQAVFIALFIETVLYGIALTMGSATILTLLRIGSEGPVAQKPLIFMLSLMLMIATPHIIISFVRAHTAFVVYPLDGPDKSLGNISDPLLNVKNILFLTQTVLGDGVNIWRFYVIYGKSVKPIIIPSIFMLAGVVCGCFVINAFAHSGSGHSVFDLPNSWIKAYDAFMITTNAYCAVAVSWKIGRTTRFHSGGGSTHPAVIVIAETGILYTSSLITFLGIYVANSNAQFIAIDLITPLVPCMFCLMVLQIKFHRNNGCLPSSYTIHALTPSRADHTCALTKIRRMVGCHPDLSISPTRSVQIQISTQEEQYPGEEMMDIRKKGESSIGNSADE
ncbi:hypothetical protein EWM64_g3614 [Hericium alpestre]|uniref:Uncharacterized protein n=1 Tax=Hericium alpestre TaxID=135208 RepID=A0A4Z0A126_9AGAM|nr:hypothetical protein EWM64_g3614 [Hericium alpestre]